VRESRSLGSVRGDRGNPVPYREQRVNIYLRTLGHRELHLRAGA
jgi:hypothetical protein